VTSCRSSWQNGQHAHKGSSSHSFPSSRRWWHALLRISACGFKCVHKDASLPRTACSDVVPAIFSSLGLLRRPGGNPDVLEIVITVEAVRSRELGKMSSVPRASRYLQILQVSARPLTLLLPKEGTLITAHEIVTWPPMCGHCFFKMLDSAGGCCGCGARCTHVTCTRWHCWHKRWAYVPAACHIRASKWS
jgi:hypothetical protein